jgi:hypothetical protein
VSRFRVHVGEVGATPHVVFSASRRLLDSDLLHLRRLAPGPHRVPVLAASYDATKVRRETRVYMWWMTRLAPVHYVDDDVASTCTLCGG